MRISIFILLLCSVMSTYTQTKEIEGCANKKKVYLFAGQSNMDGRGNGDELSKKDLERLAKVADRILFYYNKKPVTPLQLTTPEKFVQNKFNITNSFGPELFFGIELAEKYPEDQFIFIKRAVGGTSLYGCWNPEWTYEKASLINEENKPKLYSDFIKYTKSVLQSYKLQDYEIKGMFWVQGEHDSYIDRWGEEPAASYGKNLKNLIERVRIDLKALEMPFIIFQVGEGKVVEGMVSTAENDDRVFLIPQSQNKSSANYYEQYSPPLWHYTTESMKRIGVEFFKVYEKISLYK